MCPIFLFCFNVAYIAHFRKQRVPLSFFSSVPDLRKPMRACNGSVGLKIISFFFLRWICSSDVISDFLNRVKINNVTKIVP